MSCEKTMNPSFEQMIPDEQILEVARQYRAAWVALGEPATQAGTALPRLCLGAVAIELYLKCFTAESECPVDMEEVHVVNPSAIRQGNGHGLVIRFESIDRTTRATIDAEWRTDDRPDRRSVSDVLRSVEGMFIESRYPYEASSNVSRFSTEEVHAMLTLLEKSAARLSEPGRIRLTLRSVSTQMR